MIFGYVLILNDTYNTGVKQKVGKVSFLHSGFAEASLIDRFGL